MRRDLFSQLLATDPVEARRRRLHPRGVVVSVSGNMATIDVGRDPNGATMIMEDVPIASGVSVAADDFVEIGYDNGHPAAPYIMGGSANVSGEGEPVIAGLHTILSATHTDTAAATIARGDLIYGNSTPKAARLAKGAANSVLTCDGNDPSWSTIPQLAGLGVGVAGISGTVALGSLANVSAPAGNRAFLGYNVYYDGSAWVRMQSGYVPWSWEMIYLGARMFKYTDAAPPVGTQMLQIDTDPEGSTRIHFRKPSLGLNAYLTATNNNKASCGLWYSGLATDASKYGELGIWGQNTSGVWDAGAAASLWKDSGSLRGGLQLGGENYITGLDANEYLQLSCVGAADADGIVNWAYLNVRSGPIVFGPDSLNGTYRQLLPYASGDPLVVQAMDIGSLTRGFQNLFLTGYVALQDPTTTYDLQLKSDSTTAFTADRALTIDVDNAARTLKLQGNLTVEAASLLNQDLTTDFSPTFAGLTLSGQENLTGKLRVLASTYAAPTTGSSLDLVFNTSLDGGYIYCKDWVTAAEKYITIYATGLDFYSNAVWITRTSGSAFLPGTDSAIELGASNKYWSNGYIDTLYGNPTAKLDGTIAAGQWNVTGILKGDNTKHISVGAAYLSSGLVQYAHLATDTYYSGSAWVNDAPTKQPVLQQMIGHATDPAINWYFGTAAAAPTFTTALRLAEVSLAPGADSTSTLGTSSLYWSNVFADLVTLNATASIEGTSVAGEVRLGQVLALAGGLSALNAVDANVCRIFRTGSLGGAYPFNQAGHIVLQPRDTGALRHIIFMTGNPSVVQWAVTGAGVLIAEDAKNMAFGTTTGTKIGTATGQKIAFHNATPVVQAAHIADATDLATCITRIAAMLVVLENKGFTAVA